MRSKEAFAYSRGTGYFCSVAADHPAPCARRVTPRRAGACHDATGMERRSRVANSSRRQFLWGARLAFEEEGISMPMLLSDFVLFSFVVVLIAGLLLLPA